MSSSYLRVIPSGAAGQRRLPSLREGLRCALDNGSPIAPLPTDAVAAERVGEMLRPDLPVTEPDAGAIVATSGSTGEPKGVVLSRSAITASAHATHQRLGGPGRWLLALPQHYVAGLMVVARSVVAGTPVTEIGSDLTGLAEAVERPAGERCYVSLVPTQLVRALRDPAAAAALARIDAVLIGGGPASADLLGRARAAGVEVVTTYGMSETCGGCVYDGIPLSNVEVCLAPEAGNVAAESGNSADPADGGRILVGGPTLFSGYRLRPDLTAQVLADDGFRTNDRGEFDRGRLRVLGRFDDLMISGGIKIDLAAVGAAARGWPDLGDGDVALVAVPDPDWGTKLVAHAEAAEAGSQLRLDRLHAYLDGRIARHEQPKELIIWSQLPRTSGGKIDRRQLAASHSSRDAGNATTVQDLADNSDTASAQPGSEEP